MKTRSVTIEGVTYPSISAASEELGIAQSTIYNRVESGIYQAEEGRSYNKTPKETKEDPKKVYVPGLITAGLLRTSKWAKYHPLYGK